MSLRKIKLIACEMRAAIVLIVTLMLANIGWEFHLADPHWWLVFQTITLQSCSVVSYFIVRERTRTPEQPEMAIITATTLALGCFIVEVVHIPHYDYAFALNNAITASSAVIMLYILLEVVDRYQK